MPSIHSSCINIGNDSIGDDIDRTSIENEFPGFSQVFDALWSLQLDAQDITQLLKFCMQQSPVTVLEVFEKPSFMKTVQHAISLGLDAHYITTALSSSNAKPQQVELPSEQLFP